MTQARIQKLLTELAHLVAGNDLVQQFTLYAGLLDQCLRSMTDADLRLALDSFENLPSTLKFNLRGEIERRGGLPAAPKPQTVGPIERGDMPGFTQLIHAGLPDFEVPSFAYCFEGEMDGWLFVRTPIGWKALINAQHELAHARKMS